MTSLTFHSGVNEVGGNKILFQGKDFLKKLCFKINIL